MKQALATLLVFLIASPASASYSLARPKTRVMGSPTFLPETRWSECSEAAETHRGIVVITYDSTSGRREWTYDLANRVLTERNALNLGDTWTYDNAGRKATRLDANGQLTTFGRDDNGRKTSETFSDGTKNEWGFDSRGNPEFEKSPTHERHFVYDELNRLQQVVDTTWGRTIVYGYDAVGNVASKTEGSVTQRFAYDARNLLISAQEGNSPAILFKYDALGRRTAVVRPNGVRSDFLFDDVGQVTSISHSKGGTTLLGFAYQYDTEGMRTRKTREDGSFEAYGYDSSRRLTEARYSSGRVVTYGRDSWGGLFQSFDSTRGAGLQTWFHRTNLFNQVTRIENTNGGQIAGNYSWDNNGNLLTESKDATFGGGTTTYSWDKQNRLRAINLPAVNSYEYDARGLRTRKVEGGIETRYLLDGADVFEELDSVGAVKRRYLNNPYMVDEALSFNESGATWYPLTDALGSIYAITDSSGAIVRSYNYDVDGKRTLSSGAGPDLEKGFQGREHGPAGKRFGRDRWADQQMGNFTQPDRAGNLDGPNRYLFALASPTMNADPTGRFSIRFDPSVWRLTDGMQMLQQARLAEVAAMEWQYSQEPIAIRFPRVATDAGHVGLTWEDFHWSVIKFTWTVKVEIECGRGENHMGSTPRYFEGSFPVIRLHYEALNSGRFGPNVIAATMLHEWVHASIYQASERALYPGRLRNIFDARVATRLYNGSLFEHELGEVIATYIDGRMFPEAALVTGH